MPNIDALAAQAVVFQRAEQTEYASIVKSLSKQLREYVAKVNKK